MVARQAIYTHGHHESVLRSHRRRTAEDSAAYLLPHLRPGMTLLDVGCGPGTITADLAGRLAPGKVTAIEVTEGALDLARREAGDRGQPNIAFAVADVQALDLPDDSFDVVHAHQVLQHLGDPVQALREMRRVCRPGGLVAARDGDYARSPGSPPCLSSTTGWRSTARLPGQTAPSRTPDADCCAGLTGPASIASPRARAPGASPHRRTGPGGAACGPTAFCTRTWPDSSSTRRRRQSPTCSGSHRAGAPGLPLRTPGSQSCTGRYCRSPDRRLDASR